MVGAAGLCARAVLAPPRASREPLSLERSIGLGRNDLAARPSNFGYPRAGPSAGDAMLRLVYLSVPGAAHLSGHLDGTDQWAPAKLFWWRKRLGGPRRSGRPLPPRCCTILARLCFGTTREAEVARLYPLMSILALGQRLPVNRLRK